MENICKTSKHRATKTVRLTLDNVETILRNNQAVKAIHLFRDPRAIMNSRLTTKWFDVKESLYNDYKLLEADATDLCNRIIHDLRAGIRLKQKYPKRFAFVMFEDLLENQKLKSEILFRFYGLERNNYNDLDRPFLVPEEVHVFKNRKSINKEYENYANWWRLELSVKAMVVIDRACINAVDFLGYKRFYTEDDLRNVSTEAFSFSPQFHIEHLYETHQYEL
ncbi:carbohydrate sulfotransferase 1-like [Mercenaria mercenaria]|uniref:carbohydrate sulfotransferase 1-like n=1 Tax=Mercenaria mercenaria TaxID=6596 RepID=UPI00234F27BA|nr:carbohydrate sulfotransferase 1-like [Mercenaria mercenaria]